MADITPSNYQYIMAFYIRPHVLEVRMNRPEKRNAMSPRVWQEIGHVFSEIVPAEADCRCVILTGAGKVFSAGIELAGANTFGGGHGGKRLDGAQRAVTTLKSGGAWQNAWKAINLCTKPVIACMQRGCFGAALEMVCFADIRYCTQDCIFQAPEVDLGIAADLGGNQLFPKICGGSMGSKFSCCVRNLLGGAISSHAKPLTTEVATQRHDAGTLRQLLSGA